LLTLSALELDRSNRKLLTYNSLEIFGGVAQLVRAWDS